MIVLPGLLDLNQDMDKEGDSFGRFCCSIIFNYLKDGSYPEGFSKAEKGSLRKRAKFFFIKEAELYYKTNPTSECI